VSTQRPAPESAVGRRAAPRGPSAGLPLPACRHRHEEKARAGPPFDCVRSLWYSPRAHLLQMCRT
jgi:hypothetical protein